MTNKRINKFMVCGVLVLALCGLSACGHSAGPVAGVGHESYDIVHEDTSDVHAHAAILAACAAHIIAAADFNPAFCPGIAEDDSRLAHAYDTMDARAAACVYHEQEQLSAYAKAERGIITPSAN